MPLGSGLPICTHVNVNLIEVKEIIMRSNCFEKKAARHQLVHQLRAQGMSYREISERVGVKAVTIWKYLTTPEPTVSKRRALSLERLRIAKEMKAAGATYREIGERFGMTASAAVEVLRAGAAETIHGICSQCGQEKDDLVRHHTDYINDTGIWVCRSCHMKFHPEALNKAKAARADKRVEDKFTILRFSGWTNLQVSIRDNGRRFITGVPPGGTKPIEAPHALRDLNALHAAESKLTREQQRDLVDWFSRNAVDEPQDGEAFTVPAEWDFYHAPAEIRSNALLWLLNQGKETL